MTTTDGDEMIGASLEEDAPSHKGKPTTGERQTTTFFRTTLCLLLKNEDFPNNVRLNRRLRRDKNDRRKAAWNFFLLFVLVEIQVAEEDSPFCSPRTVLVLH